MSEGIVIDHETVDLHISVEAMYRDELAEKLKQNADKTRSTEEIRAALADPDIIRGSAGQTLVDWTFTVGIDVTIDLANCMWATASVLIATRAKIFTKSKSYEKVIRTLEDVREVYRALTGREPPAYPSPVEEESESDAGENPGQP